ncbi:MULTISPECIES: 2-oxoglutarate dehydrogenase complex dihydrolipoyllysine-residue succinyltransferase [Halomonadaceae]|jgi:2-oxoglutarate dehydrogenase E2 component (dihydrolipoamide succinyltransferase)|uniref:Dihydrolipoyllysine-residue succinyltransferase component of 2-oxoglutarate dehydrogenase complex n=1 Tax=Vreelandella aquamarina TaxID=77097 RepID=A0A0D7V1P6_9GAMM|nr:MULTISPECIES: 2-oxoglutarate dehydrogenase complex dihydrolipoyllysine-residue succinyltransferase [Halomonas]KTG28110.1 2-oxoglutarate dehydrogenase [Idiomarina sp. H105]MEC9020671.1 2-oxoglutarate dehydrogenase complex dihydrolipoyllysine-residue succinyltransferase [Pseudomonadota bacterium]OAF07123.1 2-oxoglutarate dehydrogenase [Idiomarina sp. WRN-38]KJD20814.1 2-oxoglutarate dehydrogenase [Halomonas meridiana]MAD21227.1 dihydrolipoyllysine-residue succinyltransferase [Halomonas sp.]|tara:strand:+ start:389 stop:1933 length:1545 start_codon:yes stop_codon:yes gene_type:complete
MATEIKAPTFPESVAEGTVAAWHKKPGDSVERDELIVEIETDKVVLEVVAPEAGTLTDVMAEEGDTVESEQVLGKIGEASGAGSKKESAASDDSAEKAESKEAAKPAGGKQHDVKAPSFPESIQEGTVATWHKKVGEAVKRDEVLADIETDKVVLEVVAPADGALAEIKAEEGSQVESEAILATFVEGGGSDQASASSSSSASSDADDEGADEKVGGKVLAPAARKMVAEHDLDVSKIEGTGKGGRILKEDVQKAVKDGSAKKAAKSSAPAKAAAAPAVEGERAEKRVPMSRLRQTIAKRLVQAQQTAAMLTTYNEVDMGAVMSLRAQYKDTFLKAHDTKLGFMGFFVKAASEALKRFPDVNASIDGTDIVYHGYQDIGVAVSTDRGLVVPVLRDTDNMKIADVEKTIVDFGKRARDGKLGIDEMQGGTFTITNGGIFGSLMSTPIINPPQTAILGMHKIQERPMAVNGKVEIRPMMYLALSYDHRMIDGKDAVQFLVTIKELLEDPARLLLDV